MLPQRETLASEAGQSFGSRTCSPLPLRPPVVPGKLSLAMRGMGSMRWGLNMHDTVPFLRQGILLAGGVLEWGSGVGQTIWAHGRRHSLVRPSTREFTAQLKRLRANC